MGFTWDLIYGMKLTDPLKIDGWKMSIFLFDMFPFQGFIFRVRQSHLQAGTLGKLAATLPVSSANAHRDRKVLRSLKQFQKLRRRL